MKDSFDVKIIGKQLISPKITISHIPDYIANEDNVQSTILKSNQWLKSLVEEGEEFEYLFSYKPKDLISAVFRISPKIRQHIVEAGMKIKVGYRLCPAQDRFHVKQCGKCLKFGHNSRDCEANMSLCAYCASHHPSHTCQYKEREQRLHHRCANCLTHAEKKWNSEDNIFPHDAFNPYCPLKRMQKIRLIQSTNWGEVPPPAL